MYYCVDTKEKAISYIDYLKTNHWRLVKARMYNSKYKYQCYCCGVSKGLQLHHKSYKTIGNENLTHLIWLCGKCHKEVHDYLKNYKSSKTTLWNVARKVRKRYYS